MRIKQGCKVIVLAKNILNKDIKIIHGRVTDENEKTFRVKIKNDRLYSFSKETGKMVREKKNTSYNLMYEMELHKDMASFKKSKTGKQIKKERVDYISSCLNKLSYDAIEKIDSFIKKVIKK